MKHLNGLHIFHVAAHSRSLREAAEKLHITHGAVSKQLKLLERYLEQPLFEKQGRGVRLTPAGESLREYTQRGFSALTAGVEQLRQHSSSQLVVSCEPTLTMRWLMPRLQQFYQQTGIDVRLSTAGGPVHLAEHELAIRRDDFPIPAHYCVTPLVDEWVGPVVREDYWQRYRRDPQQICLLHSRSRIHAWRDWLEQCQSQLGQGSLQQFEHFYFCLQAVIDGLGAAIGSYPLVADDLQQGRMIAPYGFVASGHRYLLLAPDRPLRPAEERFRHWLLEQLSDCIPNS